MRRHAASSVSKTSAALATKEQIIGNAQRRVLAPWRKNPLRTSHFSTAAMGASAATGSNRLNPLVANSVIGEKIGWTFPELGTFLVIASSAALFMTGGFSNGSPESSPFAKFGGGGGGGGGGTPGSTPVASFDSQDDKKHKEQQRAARTSTATLRFATKSADQWSGQVSWTERMKSKPVSFPETYDVSVRAYKGGRLSMEDDYFIAEDGRFAGVFDGHGGAGVSSLLRARLYNHMSFFLKEIGNSWDGKSTDGNDDTPSITSKVEAIRMAFDAIEKDALADDSLQYQGSTAVTVMVHEGEEGSRTLVSANVGDSRAVLSRKGRAVDLTRDHKPNDDREKSRIHAMGEKVEWDHYSKVHRVRNLSLSRAVGDRFAKPAVSGEVEIKRFPVCEADDEFVVMASDGLWDVMTSQDTVDFVRKRSNAPLSPHASVEDRTRIHSARRNNMSRYVASEALKRGTADNVCVVIIWLKDLEIG